MRHIKLKLILLLTCLAVPADGAVENAPMAFRDVFPSATHAGPVAGSPPAAPVYRGDDRLGFAFYSRSVAASVGYSGKPLNVLIGLDLDGRITKAILIEHNEPILAIGLSDADLQTFTRQYNGRDIRAPIRVSTRAPRSTNAIDAISGASVSSVVLNDAIMRSARAVARSRGILGESGHKLDFDAFSVANWNELTQEGSIFRRRLSIADAAAKLAGNARLYPEGAGPSDPTAPFIDIYMGLATPVRVGRNLIRDQVFNDVTARLSDGDQLIFVAASGAYSFRGRNFRKLGYFDRIQIIQGARSFRLAAEEYVRIDRLKMADAPEFRERALFILRKSAGFTPLEPWRIDISFSGLRPNGAKSFAAVSQTYELPRRYLRTVAVADTDSTARPIWWQIWQDRLVEIFAAAIALTVLTAFFFFQDWGARHRTLYNYSRNLFLIFTLVGLGWFAGAQLSVINVLTFTRSILGQFHWDFYLLEPLIFILWSGTALSLLFWGRGAFCGWLCPFGALQELLANFASKVRLPQYRLPWGLHERVWPLKYIIFAGLFALFLGREDLAMQGAEVEPFKTAIVLGFDRTWPFVAYAVAVLAIGLVINRFFCRYICPLGAALALPARLRMFEWLKRRWQCGLQCHICADQCPLQAIHPDGHINPNECIYCLKCQVIYNDDTVCPPLVEKRKRKDSRLNERLVQRFEKAEAANESGGE